MLEQREAGPPQFGGQQQNQGEAPPAHRRKALSHDYEEKKNQEPQGDDASGSEYDDSDYYDSEDEEGASQVKSMSKKQQPGLAIPKLAMGKIKVGIMDSYKSRSARPEFYNKQLLATESADMTTKQGHILLQKNLQLKFLGDENEELRNKVQNLEKMVKVNKEIMATMLTQECSSGPTGGDASASTSLETQLSAQFKRQIELLETRNVKLETDVEAAGSQKLVFAQIIQDMKNQDDAQQTVVQEELKKLQDIIDRKEYLLQHNELKVYHYEKYLQRKGLLDGEARQLLNKFQMDDPVKDQRVSNIVGDNLNLKNRLKETVQDVNRVEILNSQQSSTITKLKLKIEKMKQMHVKAAAADADSMSPVSPDVMRSDRKVKMSHMDGMEDLRGSGIYSIQELPSLRCSIIEAGDNRQNAGENLGKVDWNELLVRESIPDDYGTIHPTDTAREKNDELRESIGNPIVKSFN